MPPFDAHIQAFQDDRTERASLDPGVGGMGGEGHSGLSHLLVQSSLVAG